MNLLKSRKGLRVSIPWCQRCDFLNVIVTQWLTLYCKNEITVLHFCLVLCPKTRPKAALLKLEAKHQNMENVTPSEL